MAYRLTEFAQERGIELSGFHQFDGDVSLIREAIMDLSALQSQYPEVADSRHKLTLAVSYSMDANDFAITRKRIITLNGNAYRNRKRLIEEYQKSVDDGWFVKGTNYKAIIHHEFGHIISNIFRIDSLEIFETVTGLDEFDFLDYISEKLSGYAASNVKGHELVSEVFADMSSEHPSAFSVQFYKLCLETIKRRRES